MASPIFVRTAKLAFDEVDPRLEDMGNTLGMSDWRVFFFVSLPLASRPRSGSVAGIREIDGGIRGDCHYCR